MSSVNDCFTLSVIIPNYNNGKYLEKCVQSVIKQEYRDLIEIVIVDDNSSDDSKSVIERLSREDSRVKGIFLHKNGKVSNARNVGLNNAVGEYVTFLDSDDFYFDSNKLESEMSLIKKYSKKNKDVVAYSSIVYSSNDAQEFAFQNIKPRHRYQGNIHSKLVLDLFSEAVMRDYCVKRKIVLSVGGYNVENNLFEDYELLLKLSKKVKFYYTGTNGTAYRDSVNGLSKKTTSTLINQKNRIIKQQIKNDFVLYRLVLIVGRFFVTMAKKILAKK